MRTNHITVIKTRRMSVTVTEVGVAGWAWSTHAWFSNGKQTCK